MPGFRGRNKKKRNLEESKETEQTLDEESDAIDAFMDDSDDEESSEHSSSELPKRSVKRRKRIAMDNDESAIREQLTAAATIEEDEKQAAQSHSSSLSSSVSSASSPTVAVPMIQANKAPESNLFKDLPNLSKETRLALSENGFEEMFEIQSKSIPLLMQGHNLVAAAQTGSGKTLAFLIPIIERLKSLEWNAFEDGLGAIVLTPTRELAMQIHQVAQTLLKYHSSNIVSGLLIGGNPRKSDIRMLQSKTQLCLVIGTPGRILDHMINTPAMITDQLRMLVLDEADRMLDEGYKDEMDQILKRLPSKNRQTMLFSATQTKRSKDLIRLCFDSRPEMIVMDQRSSDMSSSSDSSSSSSLSNNATRKELWQSYMIVPTEKKFLLLFSMIRKLVGKSKKKLVVFVSTVAVTKYLIELLKYVDVSDVYGLYGKMAQKQRGNNYMEFVEAPYGVLIATNVAARGLDFIGVDWIIAYDPPSDIKEYVHRVGRTCRGKIEGGGSKAQGGRALQLLIPDEIGFISELKKKIPNIGQLNELEFPSSKISDIQAQLEKLTSTVYHLHVLSHQAYQSYLREYGLRPHSVYDVLTLDIVKVALSLGLKAPPSTTVETVRVKKRTQQKKYKTAPLRLRTNQWAKTRQKSRFYVKMKGLEGE